MMLDPSPGKHLFGVVGYPLQQSLSPLIHNWGFSAHELPCTYLAWSIEPQYLPHFSVALRTLPISGVSVTIPHKKHIMPYLDRLTHTSVRIGAVNTLYWQEGEIWGENTDITGFVAPLLSRAKNIFSALVLGAGGAAQTCLEGFRRMEIGDIWVSSRNKSKAQAFAVGHGIRYVPWNRLEEMSADLLVNATPMGMKGQSETTLPFTPEPHRFPLVYDLVYNPVQTKLLREAEEAGCSTINGLSMFITQATEQFRIWTGEDLPHEDLASMLQEHLTSN